MNTWQVNIDGVLILNTKISEDDFEFTTTTVIKDILWSEQLET